jgi:hypothetical protein
MCLECHPAKICLSFRFDRKTPRRRNNCESSPQAIKSIQSLARLTCPAPALFAGSPSLPPLTAAPPNAPRSRIPDPRHPQPRLYSSFRSRRRRRPHLPRTVVEWDPSGLEISSLAGKQTLPCLDELFVMLC